MKTRFILLCLLTGIGAPSLLPAFGGDQHHDHGQHMSQKPHAHHSAAGEPGKPAMVNRTIHITMLDTMRYEPSSINVKAGETIRFVVENRGWLIHEFGIGTAEDQMEHAEMMKAMPDMQHDDPNIITVESGQRKELIWRFTKTGTFEIACHVPGHYPAGMKMVVAVK
jgi:uncharacterized cupredoxin-like copper-binding protein